MQYADDTILFLKDDVTMATQLKFRLDCYEKMSGMKINIQKSGITCIGEDRSKQKVYEQLFGCNSGTLPIKYLGIPISYSRLERKSWKPLIDEMYSNLARYESNDLSLDDRVALAKSSLSSTLIHMMSFYKLLDWVSLEVDGIWVRFLWHGTLQKREYHRKKWYGICFSKEDGSLLVWAFLISVL